MIYIYICILHVFFFPRGGFILAFEELLFESFLQWLRLGNADQLVISGVGDPKSWVRKIKDYLNVAGWLCESL